LPEAKKEPEFRNSFWTGFIYVNRERLGAIEKNISRIQKMICPRIGDPDVLCKRLDGLANKISIAEELLAEIALEAPEDLEFRTLVRDISIGNSDLTTIAVQRLLQDVIEEDCLRYEELQPYKISSQTMSCLKNVMNECSNVMYGDYASSRGPILVCWPYAEYQYLPNSRAICFPPTESERFCFWSGLAHEGFHCKIHDFTIAKARYEDAKEEKDEARQERSHSNLQTMVSDSWKGRIDDLLSKWNTAYGTFRFNFKLMAGEAYRELYQVLFADDFYLPREFLPHQFREILCDVASLKIAGLSDLIFLGSQTADLCRNTELDLTAHFFDLAHPPDTVRFIYTLEVLTGRDLNNREITKIEPIAKDNLDYFVENAKELVRSILSEEKVSESWKELTEFHLIQTYNDLIIELLPDICEIVDALLCHADFYNQVRWSQVMQRFDEIEREKTAQKRAHALEALETSKPFDLVNLGWLKFFDLFRKTVGKSKTLKEFFTRFEAEDLYFGALWKKLSKL